VCVLTYRCSFLERNLDSLRRPRTFIDVDTTIGTHPYRWKIGGECHDLRLSEMTVESDEQRKKEEEETEEEQKEKMENTT
jgi:hypothetical protein